MEMKKIAIPGRTLRNRPTIGVLAGWQVLGEPLTAALLFALALVAAGIYFVNRQVRAR